ncbi:MAG: PP2C family serine/threonine-protein phosphatase [Polyangiales bacterium]
MSSPHEDKSGAVDTSSPPNGPTTIVSVSGPLLHPDEATWGKGEGLHVRYAGRSAVGLVREHNEDNFVIANLTTGQLGQRETSLTDLVGEGGLLFAVCDGMGGAAAGEVASQMAVDVLHEAMRRGGVPRERDVLARRLVSAVEEAGRRIFDAAQKERSRRGMGTTATAAVLSDKVLFLAEVGDSRAYLLRAGTLKQLTKDQSLVNQLIEAGHLTEAEAEAFEHSNIILQALGTSETVQVDLTFVELRRGDRLMLCSDGLSGLVSGETLREALLNIDDPAECTAALVKFAEAGGGHDNITVVVTDFAGDELDLPRDSDSFGYVQYPLVPSNSAAFSEEEVTETAKPLGRSSLDALPAYEPPPPPGVDSNPWLWISAGLTALLVGAWLLAAGSSFGSVSPSEGIAADRGSVVPAERAEPTDGTDKPSELAATKAVPVRVFSDVQDAVLLVNGETHGRLNSGQAQAMDLQPGAYRFEAQSHGNTAAVEVVNVQQDSSPVDVYLRVPGAANEPGAATAAAPNAPHQEGSAAVPAPGSAPSEPAAAAPSAAHAEHAAPTPAAPHAAPSGQAADPNAKPASPAAPSAPTPGAVADAPSAPGEAPAGGADKDKPKGTAVAAARGRERRKGSADASGSSAPGDRPAPPDSPNPPAAAPKPQSPIPDNPF